MARTIAELPKGPRIADYISLGVIGKRFPLETIQGILERTGRGSQRQRELPAHVVVYYVIALALPAGRAVLAGRAGRDDQGDRQVGHFPGAQPVGRAALAGPA